VIGEHVFVMDLDPASMHEPDSFDLAVKGITEKDFVVVVGQE
jgi:hypothetical protein